MALFQLKMDIDNINIKDLLSTANGRVDPAIVALVFKRKE